MTIELAPIKAADIPAFRTELARGYGHNYESAGDERFASLMPLDRTVAAFEGDQIVGTLGDFPLQLTVPGGTRTPMAGTTMVTVRATHTRRGILRSMVRRHLDNAVLRGEHVAGLWASEPGIYGRFGFGLASENHAVRINSRRIAALPIADDLSLRLIDAQSLHELVAPFWSEIATSDRPGFIDRSAARWQDLIHDPEWSREGATAARHLVAERHGKVVGYLAYRQREKWDDFSANGAITINALVGADIDAHLALWAFALDVDLFPNVDYWAGAMDDPLAYVVSDARVIKRTTIDALYLRILDVPAALGARTYEQDGEVTFRVSDNMGYIGGAFHLKVVDGQATTTVTTDTPDIELGSRELGALYLGRVCADLYASMGYVTGDQEAVRRLGRMFATSRAPWCPEMF